MSSISNKITYIGKTDFRNEEKKFGIKEVDRFRHVYIIGKTGVGKSTLIENMIAQDIYAGNGIAFLDPHGASAEKMLDYIPEHRVKDVIYMAPFDTAYPISFNVLEDAGGPEERHKVANGILSVMKRIWVDAFSGRMEYLVQMVLLALLEYPGATFLGFNRMLTDKEYRNMIVDNVSDPSVRSFWIDDYGKWDDKYRREAGAAIQNKVGQFTSNPLIRNIIAQPKSTFDLNEVMDNKKILIANLSKGLLGEQNAQLLGSMLSTKIYLASMSRARHSEEYIKKELPGFYLYADEFQNFASDSFAGVLAEARKYKLSLTMAHQYIAQLPETVRDAILGNVGSMIVFRIGPDDAEIFEKQFAPDFVQQDLVNLGYTQIYLQISIDGLSSRPFSARTLPPIAKPEVSMRDAVFQSSRQLYARPRHIVESEIETWFQPILGKKDVEHEEFLARKRAEVEARGEAWIEDPALRPKTKPVMERDSHRSREYREHREMPPRSRSHNQDNRPPRPLQAQAQSTSGSLKPEEATRQQLSVSSELDTLLRSGFDFVKDGSVPIAEKVIPPVSTPQPVTTKTFSLQQKLYKEKQTKDASKDSQNSLRDIIRKAQQEAQKTSTPLDSHTKVAYTDTTTQGESANVSSSRMNPEDVLR